MATRPTNASLTPEGHVFAETPEQLEAQINGMLAVCIIFLVLTTACVGARVYVRTKIVRSFGIDDWLTCLTLVIFWAPCLMFAWISTQVLGNLDGFAAGEIPVTMTIPDLIVDTVCLYAATMIVFKCAVGFFFIKIFPTIKVYRVLIYASMALSGLFGLFNIVWTRLYPCEVQSLIFVGLEACMNHEANSYWEIFTAIFSLFTAITDALYAVLAILALVKIQIPRRARGVAVLLILLGSMGAAASVVRCVVFITPITSVSLLGEALLAAIWCIVEPGLGIVAASLVTLRPLIRKLNESSSRGTGTGYGGRSGTGGPGSNSAGRFTPSATATTNNNSFHGGHKSATTTIITTTASSTTPRRGGTGLLPAGRKPDQQHGPAAMLEVELDQWRRPPSDDEEAQLTYGLQEMPAGRY